MKRKLVLPTIITAMAVFGTVNLSNAFASTPVENPSAHAIRVDSNEEKPESYRIFTAKEPLMDVADKQFELAEILKRHQGKLIYLDVWASWCGPCRREMPHSKELQKEYGDRVVFLYISCDKAEAAWKKAHAEENFDESTSFRIPDMEG